jgi:hypothetical protein
MQGFDSTGESIVARIRTIKPELWTDERITECSMPARLLFIGMLNFSDDNGNMSHSAKRLKMQVFPSDDIDVAPLLEELISEGMLLSYSVRGENYLHIKGFKKHQVINKPTQSTTPKPPLPELYSETPADKQDDSGPTTVVLPTSSATEWKGMEGNGKDIPPQKTAPKSKPKSKTALPNDFKVSERVEAWAATKGYVQMQAHLENFISAAKRKGYTYADWDEALMEAVRKNWAQVFVTPERSDSRFAGAT